MSDIDYRERTSINGFAGDYRFLSNFYYCPVVYDGTHYCNAEAAYQSAKTLDLSQRVGFQQIGPNEAKRLGRSLALRPDWCYVKFDVMRTILNDKFNRNHELMDRLVATGDAHLEETNDWGDTTWGVCGGTGDNVLGKMLMSIRDTESRKRLTSIE